MKPERLCRPHPSDALYDQTVFVGGATRWNTPFKVHEIDQHQMKLWGWTIDPQNHLLSRSGPKDLQDAVDWFRYFLMNDQHMQTLVKYRLHSKSLSCPCPLPAPGEPDLCHATILILVANAEPFDPR